MSKKSRRRNKKILAALALAGGAALMGRGRGEISSNRPSGIDTAMKAASSANKVPANVGNTGNTITRTSGITLSPSGQKIGAGGLQGGKSRGELAQILAAKGRAPKGIYPPGMIPMHTTHPRAGSITGRYKKGGRVTGAAKRGFGRALMKGKK